MSQERIECGRVQDRLNVEKISEQPMLHSFVMFINCTELKRKLFSNSEADKLESEEP